MSAHTITTKASAHTITTKARVGARACTKRTILALTLAVFLATTFIVVAATLVLAGPASAHKAKYKTTSTFKFRDGDTRGPCPEGLPNNPTFSCERLMDGFYGQVQSKLKSCRSKRKVGPLYRADGSLVRPVYQGNGYPLPDPFVTTTIGRGSGIVGHGYWSIGTFDPGDGTYTATVKKRVIRKRGHRHVCRPVTLTRQVDEAPPAGQPGPPSD